MRTTAVSRGGNKRAEVSFTTGSIPRAMLRFVWPTMLGILLQNLYGAVDLFVVGHYASTADVSAVTIGSQLMSLATQLIIGFATGITVLVGQARGAQDQGALSRTAGTSIALFGSCAAVLTAVYLAAHGPLVAAMQTPTAAVDAARSYLVMCAVGIPFIVGYNVITSIMTGLGDSRTPFLFVAVACVINIVLDLVLVCVIPLGALGAAIATTIAQAGSFLFAIIFLRKKGLGFPLSRADIRFDRVQVGRIARIGGPVAVQNVMVGVSFLFVTAVINRIGLTASAAVGVVEKLITFLFVPASALGIAVGTASAQNLGAQQPVRARQSMWWGAGMALVPSALILVLCQVDGTLLTGILNNDPEVVALAADYLRSYIVDIVLVSFVFSMNGYFNSCGKSWFSLVHSLATTFAVRIPAAWLLSRLPGASLYLIGWAAPMSTACSLVICLLFLARHRHHEEGTVPAAPGVAQPAASAGRRVVVTISREYGSGGRLIGERVAQILGVPFYNRNLIDLTAQRSGLAQGYIARWEEQISSPVIWTPIVSPRAGVAGQMAGYYSNEDRMFQTQSEIIREVAEHACVIVGRCADYVLREHPDRIRVFIRSQSEQRIRRLVDEYGIAPERAAEVAANTDKGRANYYSRYTHMRWGDGRHYDLVIDSSVFGIEQAAQLIVQAIHGLYPEMAEQERAATSAQRGA